MVHLPFDACLKLHNKLWCLHECTGPSNERSCLKILDNCLAIVILAEKDSGKTSPFSSLFDPTQINTKALLQILLSLFRQ